MQQTAHRFALFAALAAAPIVAHAQQLEVPAPSPKARIEQRVGLTDVSLDYSSPGVKGRKIWGGLVPYDKRWRAGANAATLLKVSRDFTFGDKQVKAGSYSLHTIPGKTTWTVILNSNPEAGEGTYDEKLDVARTSVKPGSLHDARERLTYIFSDTTADSTNLDLEWEKLRLRVPIKVDTAAQVAANIEEATNALWRPHMVAARYLLDNGGDLDKALGYADKSIAIQSTWTNQWVKAQILGKQGKKADALAAATEAQKLGANDNTFQNVFKADVEKAMAGWK